MLAEMLISLKVVFLFFFYTDECELQVLTLKSVYTSPPESKVQCQAYYAI